jgi:SulP family sulfate permease
MAVLAGILMTVGIGIIDRKGLGHLRAAPRGDTLAMLIVLTLTVFVDLMWAVAIGMVISSLLLVKQLADLSPAKHGSLDEHRDARPDLTPLMLPQQILAGVHLVEMQQVLFFGNAGPMQRMLATLKDADAIVLELHRVTYIDQSGAYAFADLLEDMKRHDTRVYVVGLQSEPELVLRQLDFIPHLVPEDAIFETTAAAVERASIDHDAGVEALFVAMRAEAS